MTEFLFNHMFIGIIAVVSLAIILVQLLLTVFGGLGDLDVDVDTDAADGGGGELDSSIFLSPKGILHFLAGASWYLVIINKDNLQLWDYVIAIVIGAIVAFLIGLLYYGLYKLEKPMVEEKGEKLVGKSVEIYLKTGKNTYDAFITKNEARVLISVKSMSDSDYAAGEMLTLRSFENGIYFID